MNIRLISKTITLSSRYHSTDELIVYIARVSSNRGDKWEKPNNLINYLIKNKHWSPFEHAFFTFEIETSRAIGRQLLRHRSFTFQEFSQRYSVTNGYEDVELRQQATNNRQSSTKIIKSPLAYGLVTASIKASDCAYKLLLKMGVSRECARSILPECTTTTLYMTGSIRSWIHFLSLRDDEHAQKEVQLIAQKIKSQLSGEIPIIAKALKWI